MIYTAVTRDKKAFPGAIDCTLVRLWRIKDPDYPAEVYS